MSAPAPHDPSPAPPAFRDRFLLCGCQGGAETALRHSAEQALPGVRPGAWRRGVVTFRLPGSRPPTEGRTAADLPLPDLVFARTTIDSFGQVTGEDDAARVAAARQAAASGSFDNVHVWRRDPSADLPVSAIRGALLGACGLDPTLPEVAAVGSVVLDCVLDSPERWWVGWHRVAEPASQWPGGVYPKIGQPLPEGTVSRAWLKLDEAIAVFGIPFLPGQRAMELGASPGGACQRLLEAGLQVVGVDPAVVDERVAAHAGFQQWRMRARDVPLRRCAGFDWLVADMNIDPSSTIAALGRIATAPAVRLEGIVATLKLPAWSRAAELGDWLDTVRSWGFQPRARQLSSGGREVCVVAVRAGGARSASDRPSRPVAIRRRPARRRPDR